MQVDGARRPPYSYDDPENSPVFNTLNLNKQSVQLNLKEPEAVELALKIASVSDAVVENMRPGVMARLGLSYDRLREVNPTLVMVSISNGGGIRAGERLSRVRQRIQLHERLGTSNRISRRPAYRTP